MIVLDTSALLRFLTNDRPRVAQVVAKLVDGSEPIGISSIVLTETVHVLRHPPYERANPELADALIELLAHENVMLIDGDAALASAAIAGVRELSPRHLVDALVSAAASHAGARLLVTADRTFASRLVPVSVLAEG